MLDLKFIRENPDGINQNIKNKNEKGDVSLILALDKTRRDIISEVEQLKNQRNVVSKDIADLKKQKLDASKQIESMKTVSEKVKKLDEKLRETELEINDNLLRITNMLHSSVPVGKSEEDNALIRRYGEPVEAAHGKDHIQISEELGILDFKRGAKVSGSGFGYYVGKGAQIERALINYFLDKHSTNGYKEIMTPFVVGEEAMKGTGQLPKMAEDMYHCPLDNLYLIPTAEVPITNFHSDEILKNEDLTIKYCGYSPCFRREAGSYGKEVHGFLRVHQFNKVELVKFARPDESYYELESLVADVESLLKELGLVYRVLLLCSGDTSFSSAKTYDLEVWAPGEKRWLEVSSCSNFEAFQARRANIRYKPSPDAKPEFVHTLNGSGLATPRILVALIEQYFDGEKLVVPDALCKYLPFEVM